MRRLKCSEVAQRPASEPRIEEVTKISSGDSDEKVMPFWGHVSELASRLKIVIVALLITCSVTWLPLDPKGLLDPIRHYQPIMSVLMQRIRQDFLPSGATLIAGGLVDTIFVYMYLSLLIGVVLAYPIIAYEVYAFISPGLYPHERKHISAYMTSFVGLFVFGLVIAYFLIIPITFKILVWFIESGGAVPLINIKDFYNWTLALLLASGLFYTIPVFVVMLVQFGILPLNSVSGRRRKITLYAGLLIVLTIITPDPTPITASIILAPFILVLEAALLVAKRIDKARAGRITETYAASTAEPVSSKCKFCGGSMSPQSPFCAVCGKSQV
jgi:sec-independent protein translocase protein TatC